MRIGVLEWICGGGLQEVEPQQITQSLSDEGRAMLRGVANDLIASGHEVAMSVDWRLFNPTEMADFESRFQLFTQVEFENALPRSWREISVIADAVLIVAPEFSNILRNAIEQLAPACKLLMNCRGDFLSAGCDKWLLAQRLETAGVRHPATCLVSHVTESWLKHNRQALGKWIVKPRDGAGCAGLQLVDESMLAQSLAGMRLEESAARMIIQPWHAGASFSRSAIVDADGRAHWLPLVTQEFRVSDSLEYLGGHVLAVGATFFLDKRKQQEYSISHLDEVLNIALRALGSGGLGWVGVDLLYCESSNDWIVVEVNPRLTTSFTGLCLSCNGGLMPQVFRACAGQAVRLASEWRSVAFNAAGEEV